MVNVLLIKNLQKIKFVGLVQGLDKALEGLYKVSVNKVKDRLVDKENLKRNPSLICMWYTADFFSLEKPFVS